MVVVINRRVKGMEDRCILLDNVHGGYLATRHLLEQGHRDIAYISGPLWWGDARARLKGHQQALAEQGLAFDERLLVEGDYHESGGVQAMQELFERAVQFTAVACGNDEMAAGAMDVVRTRGLSIPDDVSVVGFDNARWARYLYPKLTTVNYPVADMGAMAARWVLKHVYGDSALEVQTLFEPELVARASVAGRSDA
jgi:LacI family transcriptional regulator